jgi:ABC-type multidrug transport system ATPase subunit
VTVAAAIRLVEVRKRYRGHGEILKGIDMEVAPGRPVVVLGGNGAGKSTLLRVVAGCSAPTAGTVAGGRRLPAGPFSGVGASMRCDRAR